MSLSSRNKKMRGFTLMEFVIYFAIVIVISTAMITAGLRTIEEKSKLTELETIERAARLAMEIITREIRNAQSIASPQGNATSTILMLVAATSMTPIAFSLNNGYFEIQKGSLAPVRITDSGTVVTAIEFQGMSYLNAVKAVRISFTLNAGGIKKNFSITQNAYTH